MSKKNNRSQRRAEIKRAKRAQKQRQRMQTPKTKRPTKEQRQRFFESLFYMRKERELIDQEQAELTLILSELEHLLDSDMECWRLSQWVNAVTDLMPYGMEWHFWDQAEDFFTIEDFEALPKLDQATIDAAYTEFVGQVRLKYDLLSEEV